ncbi:MAG: helix-turn-helix domain-containing protein, partial [Solirubrobacteraceae bacterium]
EMAPGRPLTPLDPTAGAAARLGAEIRRLRLERKLTLSALGDLAGYSPQHLSDLERGRSSVTRACIAALDDALGAGGALLELLPAAVTERAFAAQDRAADRRYDDGDVDPTNRRGLLDAAAAAALGGAALGPAPTAARDVDPEMAAHWTALLAILGAHDAAHGPHGVLTIVERELGVIAAHRAVARGGLRTTLMRVEARWAQFAAWLSNDVGQAAARRAWADRARRLATQADYPDMLAFIHVRQSQWAAQQADAHHAVAFAQAALRVPGTSEQTRARSALRAAYGYALANDAAACEHSLADAEATMEHSDPPPEPPWVGRATIRSHVRPDEARCWLAMQPRKAIGLYEHVLRNWPRDRVRDRGLHQARLAVACAAAGELDRAQAEGRKALAITRSTKSSGATRELRRLREAFSAA